MHTEGKIKASPINKSGFIIITKELNDDDEIMIDLMVHDGKEENGIANAARIVKTWNMHDELVNVIADLVGHFDDDSRTTFSDKKKAVEKAKLLLQQAKL